MEPIGSVDRPAVLVQQATLSGSGAPLGTCASWEIANSTQTLPFAASHQWDVEDTLLSP